MDVKALASARSTVQLPLGRGVSYRFFCRYLQGDAGSDEGNFIMPSAARVVATGLLKEVIWDESCRTFFLMGEIL